MSFEVIWLPAALDRLAELWTAAADQRAVTEASERLDRAVRRDPFGAGESRGGNQRVVFDPPLAIVYEVLVDRREVQVVSCGLSNPRQR